MKLSNEKMLEMYETMYRIRAFESKGKELFLEGKLPGFIHIYLGEEAVATGVCATLNNNDQITSTHRGHGHCIAKGGRTDLMFAELYGKETGYCKGKGGSMHIADPALGILGANGIVGAGMPIATGAAFALKYNKTDNVAVTFFGDGASNRGTFHEALNMASTWKLPVVFVCENNGYGLTTAQARHQNIKDISVRAAAYGIEGVTVDGNDVLAVYEAAEKAVTNARKGGGPTLIECKTYRHSGHYVGDPEKYRSKEEVEAWMSDDKDPIPRFAAYLLEKKITTKEAIKAIRSKVDEEIVAAVEFAVNSPDPDPANLLKGTLVEI